MTPLELLSPVRMDHVPDGIESRAQSLLAGQWVAPHVHLWPQVIYVTAGSLRVTDDARRHVVRAGTAVWLPAGVQQTFGTAVGAQLHSLCLQGDALPNMPSMPTVLDVSSSLRTLILDLGRCAAKACPHDGLKRTKTLALAQLAMSNTLDTSLPWPAHPTLSRLCDRLYEDSAETKGIEAWSKLVGLTGRGLAERFAAETGMAPNEWRHRVRVFRGMEWLAEGRSLSAVAGDLGFGSPSAFAHMFRLATESSPSAWARGAGEHS
ncbi:MAG: AraC family transcriptional regulator [Luteibacter sp.]|uniref:AraC family transcriptional regulator n=1 Tax=Luteibacter sp. TaxID=1886636 RepID=UPI002807C9CD|nr:AraC family transcriptional regulator [Luteibacter sp.]MDQ7995245.1 AraC family transcriptional regulator [Luteibacter sp.]